VSGVFEELVLRGASAGRPARRYRVSTEVRQDFSRFFYKKDTNFKVFDAEKDTFFKVFEQKTYLFQGSIFIIF
jgi:hypothetical protein